MSKTWKLALLAVLLLAGAAIAIPFLVDADTFRPALQSSLTDILGREVIVGELRLSLLEGGLHASDIRIADDPAFGAEPFLNAGGLSVGIQWMPLLRERRLVVEQIALRSPSVRLLQNQQMRWNFDSLGKRKAPAPDADAPASPTTQMELTVRQIRLTDGKATIRPAGLRREGIVVDSISLTLDEVAAGRPVNFSLTAAIPPGGAFRSRGTAGPAHPGDITHTPVDATFEVSGLNLVESGLVQPAANLRGILSGQGTVAASDGAATATLNAELLQFALGEGSPPSPKPLSLEATIQHQLTRNRGSIRDAKLRAGEATATLSGAYRITPEATMVDATLRGEQMPVDELSALLPSVGVVLPQGATLSGGALDVKAAAEGPTTALNTAGEVSLSESVLTGYSLGSAVQTAARLAGLTVSNDTPIQLLRADLVHTPGQTRLDNIRLEIPTLGQVEGNLAMAADQQLLGSLLARVETKGGITGAGLERFTGTRQNTLSIPLRVSGSASQPEITADADAIGKAVTKQAVEQLVPKAKSLLDRLFGGNNEEAPPPAQEPEKQPQ